MSNQTTTPDKLWVKRTDSLYEILLENKTVPIHVPFAKSQLVFELMLRSGISIDDEGQVKFDPISIIRSMQQVGNLLLTEYSDKGEVKEEGYCGNYSNEEVKALFEVGMECFQNFLKVVLRDPTETPAQGNEKGKKATKKQ